MRYNPGIDDRISKFHETELLKAVKNEDLQRVQELLKRGANPNLEFWIESQILMDDIVKIEQNCFSILNFVSCHKNTQIAELLLQYNAQVNWPNRSNWTALHTACMNLNKPIADLLIANGANTSGLTDKYTELARPATPKEVWDNEEKIAADMQR